MWGLISLAIYILSVTVYIPYSVKSYDDSIYSRFTIYILVGIYSLLFLLLGWSWGRVRFTDPGNILRPQKLTGNEVQRLENGDIQNMPIPPDKT